MVSLQRFESKRKQRKRGPSVAYRWRIQLMLNGKRESLWIGPRTKAEAERIAEHVDLLLRHKANKQSLPPELQEWLRQEQPLTAKLAKLGLCKKLINPTVWEFSQSFLEDKICAQSTRENFQCAFRHVQEYFATTRIMDVGPQEALAFSDWLQKRPGLSINTLKRRLGRVRELFQAAVEQQLITSNPFKLRSISVNVGAAEKDYIPAETVLSVIDYLPADKAEWKLLFAFSRFYGLRIPSEIRELTWDRLNFERSRIVLASPKTAIHGKPERAVPIFNAVIPFIELQRELAGDQPYLFPRLRTHSNTATTAKKLVVKAGFAPWGEFWNALRASCETDLMDRFGVRKACMWVGNTPAVAFKNYSLMNKTGFDDLGSQKNDAKSDALWSIFNPCQPVKPKENPGKQGLTTIPAPPVGMQLCAECKGKGYIPENTTQKTTHNRN